MKSCRFRGLITVLRNYRKRFLQTKSYDDWVRAFDLLKIHGAGWMGKPGLAFGKNAPYAPDGSFVF
jgi:hypothetical protein